MSLTKASYSLVTGAPVNVLDYGVSTASSDNSAAFAAAIASGTSIYIPAGTYTITSTLVIPNLKTVIGADMSSTVIQYTGTGDGVQLSNNAVNGSGYASITLRNLKIYCTNASNVGAGLAVNAGGYSYYEIDTIQSTGFKYGCVLDQAEVSSIKRCIFETRTRTFGAPLWLTNGPQWRAGALKRFTNDITVKDCQFNQGFYSIIDDGGNVHAFIGNNLNDSANGIRFAGVTGLTFIGHAIEGGNTTAGSHNLSFLTTDGTTALTTVGPCQGFTVSGNAFSCLATDGAMIKFDQDYHSGGTITNNYFIGAVGGPTAIDVQYLSQSFCGFNYDTGPLGAPRAHYSNIHNDSYGNVLYPPTGSNNSDSTLPYTFGNTGNYVAFSGGIGYGTGAGGTVTQATSKTTTVVLNKMCGKITMNNASLAAGATATFGLNNTFIQSTDLLLVNAIQIGGTYDTANYQIWASPNSGGNSASICVKNISGGALTDALQINFGVVKSVTT